MSQKRKCNMYIHVHKYVAAWLWMCTGRLRSCSHVRVNSYLQMVLIVETSVCTHIHLCMNVHALKCAHTHMVVISCTSYAYLCIATFGNMSNVTWEYGWCCLGLTLRGVHSWFFIIKKRKLAILVQFLLLQQINFHHTIMNYYVRWFLSWTAHPSSLDLSSVSQFWLPRSIWHITLTCTFLQVKAE